MRTLTKVSKLSIEHRYYQESSNRIFKVFGCILLFLIMFCVATPTFAQEKKKKEIPVRKIDVKELEKRKSEGRIVKGKVLFSAEGLPGVSIVLKGTNQGIDTDYDGNFRFPLPLLEGDILVFSFVGFADQELKMDKQTNYYNVKMKEGSEVLELIVLDAPQTTQLFKSNRKDFKKKKTE